MENGETIQQPPALTPPPVAPPPLSGPLDPEPPHQPKWRWGIHLFLLSSYVLGIGLLAPLLRGKPAKAATEAILPPTVNGLLATAAIELLLFFLFLGLAFMFSRPTAKELLLCWRGGIKTFFWGAAYSVILRVAVMIVMFAIFLPYIALHPDAKNKIEELRPKTEVLFNPKALNDPVYFALMLTLVSFVVAALREELWRAGMLAGFRGIAPGVFGSKAGQVAAVIIVAIIFGFGHFPQGVGATVLTGALGLGLGLIMLRHDSIWEAVIAHGFFDASTFALLFLLVKYFPGALPGTGLL